MGQTAEDLEAEFEHRERVLRDGVKAAGEAAYYLLNNPYLTQEQKKDVEGWFQLPMHAQAVTTLGLVIGGKGFWEAIFLAWMVSVPIALITRAYFAPIFVKLGRILFRLAPFAYGASFVWGIYKGDWYLAGMSIAAFFGLLGMLTPAFLVMSYTSSDIAPKYLFASRYFGITFPFEKAMAAAEEESKRPLTEYEKKRLFPND